MGRLFNLGRGLANLWTSRSQSSLVNNFKKISAFPDYALSFHETYQDK